MIGVAIVNAHTYNVGFDLGNFAWDTAKTTADRAAEIIANLVFAHRAFPLLAFLLGLGLVLQASKFESAAPTRLWPRYIALLTIGVLHGLLLWPGEILTCYALIVLVMGRYAVAWSDRTLERVVCGLLILSFVFALWGVVVRAPFSCDASPFFGESSFAKRSWLAARVSGVREFLMAGFAQTFLTPLWALLLLGVWAGRQPGFWAHLRRPSFFHPVVMASAAMLILSTFVEFRTGVLGGWDSRYCTGGVAAVFSLAENTTIFASVPVVLTVFAWISQRARLTVFVHVGRAPLTMFLGQSALFQIVFSHALIGLHGKVGRAAEVLIALAVYGVLACVISFVFFGAGRATPGEQAWRWLTGWIAARQPAPE